MEIAIGIIVGLISDTLNRPIEFANLAIQGTSVGSSSDENGI